VLNSKIKRPPESPRSPVYVDPYRTKKSVVTISPRLRRSVRTSSEIFCWTFYSAPKKPIVEDVEQGLIEQEDPNLICTRYLSQNSVLKIIVAGDGGVGKTSLIRRYVSDCFNPAERITIGCDFYTKVLNAQNGQQFKLQIWDVGGQEQFRALLPLWSKGSRGAILAFDIGSIESYLHLDEWLSIVLEGGKTENFPIIVVGNKRDLSDGSIMESDLDQYIQKRGLNGYFLVSAKDGISVSSPFIRLLDLITDHKA
jgi:small GTP-binding protein